MRNVHSIPSVVLVTLEHISKALPVVYLSPTMCSRGFQNKAGSQTCSCYKPDKAQVAVVFTTEMVTMLTTTTCFCLTYNLQYCRSYYALTQWQVAGTQWHVLIKQCACVYYAYYSNYGCILTTRSTVLSLSSGRKRVRYTHCPHMGQDFRKNCFKTVGIL